MSKELNNLVNAIEAVTTKSAQKSGKGYRLQCSGHDGKDRNLYVADGDTKLIIKCHSHGCDPKDIIEAAGLELKDIYYDSNLTPVERKNYKNAAYDRLVKKELEQELLVLLLWIDDGWQDLFPRNPEKDPERVKLALERIVSGCGHFIKEGVK